MFRKKRTEPLPVSALPDGVAGEFNGVYYLSKGSKVFSFYSKRCFDTWGLTPLPLAGHPAAVGTIGFRDGTLIEDISSGLKYLISGAKKRLVTNPDVLLYFEGPLVVSRDEAGIHEDGEDLNGL